MSLDVYLSGPKKQATCSVLHHYCKECYADFEHEHMRDATEQFYSANITHNLGGMANEAGIYYALWRPAELDLTRREAIRFQSEAKNWHGPGGVYELEKAAPTTFARDIAPLLRDGVTLMKADPARFEAFNSPNGRGLYKNFLPWVERYLAACEEYPDAIVTVSR